MENDKKQTILLTGATGYIGGRLLKELEKADVLLRCLVREPRHLEAVIDPRTTLVKGDVLDKKTIVQAMQGVDIAYYLIHSMGSKEDFTEQDRLGAENFGEAASEMGVKRIIYLGGLAENRDDLSTHLKSRHEVGECLRENAHGVQVLEFRASIVIGSGSVSFEMIRALCERLPVMIAPRWVWNLAQPISIKDVITYLKEAATISIEGNHIFEIGGQDQVSYGEIMFEYMRQRQLKRFVISVPVLTPYLSSLWLGLVTPIYARIGRKLVDSARFPTVVKNKAAEQLFKVHPMGIADAIKYALHEEDMVVNHWASAMSSSGKAFSKPNVSFGHRLFDIRTAEVPVTPREAFIPIRRLGGTTGWYYGKALWQLRGFLDLLVGGVGLRRGRRDPDQLRAGDFLDFWRVEEIEPDRRLLLRAEMRLPGRAWLEFTVEPTSHGTRIRQHAIFDPIGLWGLLYWYLLYPIHRFVFAGMLRGIANTATQKTLK